MARTLALAIVLLITTPALAQQQGTAEEQAACRGDAIRFCASHAGNQPAMRQCLAANKARLSPACRAVVEARGG
jgi:uncharacterized protein YdeI (BOF family)